MSKRLGYACINMTLAEEGVSCNRTMIKKTFEAKGLPYASEIILSNLKGLKRIVQWNNDNGIKVYRMSSSMFPWMSHYEFSDLPDYKEICTRLSDIGKLAIDNDQRLSFHPGQFCVLASKSEKVVNAINELDKSAEIMDLMGLPKSRMAKINIHVGGAYGDKKSALERFCKNYLRTSSSVQARLTVENDDKASMYSVLDLYNGVFTWRIGIRQCTHYSESRREEQTLIVENLMSKNNITSDNLHDWPTIETLHKEASKIKLQAHSDYITEEIKDYGLDIDVVIEAKAKELTVFDYFNQHQHLAYKDEQAAI